MDTPGDQAAAARGRPRGLSPGPPAGAARWLAAPTRSNAARWDGVLYAFFNGRWLVDKVYNDWLAAPFHRWGHTGATRLLDRGLFEHVGPLGVAAGARRLAGRTAALQTGLVSHYALLMVAGLAGVLLLAAGGLPQPARPCGCRPAVSWWRPPCSARGTRRPDRATPQHPPRGKSSTKPHPPWSEPFHGAAPSMEATPQPPRRYVWTPPPHTPPAPPRWGPGRAPGATTPSRPGAGGGALAAVAAMLWSLLLWVGFDTSTASWQYVVDLRGATPPR